MIVLDLSFIDQIVSFINNFINMINYDIMTAKTSTDIIMLFMFKYWGALLYLAVTLRYLFYPEYINYIQARWVRKTVTPVILAIDVPRMNEQSIQAMENLFDHLLGAHHSINWWARYIVGEFQLSFSCELISIEGNIQFLIRTPNEWRNLVESAVYGQFPDAEITEVADYVNELPRRYPNNTHDLYGCEFSLSNKNLALPIKTWTKFEHKFTEVFVDPLAGLLESMSQIGPGEQIWIQFIIVPLPVDWAKDYQKKYIDKFLGRPEPAPKPNMIGGVLDQTMILASEVANQAIGSGVMGAGEEKKKEEQPFKIMNLTPGQKEALEAMERKISKLAYSTKIRYVYISEKAKTNKAVGVSAVMGSFKQFTDMNGNGIKPMLKETGTNSCHYVLIEYRRNTRRNYIMWAYRNRDWDRGIPGKPLTSEELASLWHFPGMNIKAPFVKATAFKKAAAPVSLPIEPKMPEFEAPQKLEKVMEERNNVMPTFDYDNDEFEKQFALDKKKFQQRPVTKPSSSQIKPKEPSPALANLIEQGTEEIYKADEQAASEAGTPPGNLPFLD